MSADTLHLLAAHVPDDLPLSSYTEPVAGNVVGCDATLVSRHDTAGRCNVSLSFHCALLYAISSPVLFMITVHRELLKSVYNITKAHSFVTCTNPTCRPTEPLSLYLLNKGQFNSNTKRSLNPANIHIIVLLIVTLLSLIGVSLHCFILLYSACAEYSVLSVLKYTSD